jgi:hypothetical protein
MKQGLLEKILTRRYGAPTLCIRDGLAAKCWNKDDTDREAWLYIGMKWKGEAGARVRGLEEIYGDSFGGVLIKNILRAAILAPRQLYSVWNIDELRDRPAVRHALVMDPAIDYFMEAYNVYFYGIKKGHLYVFDVETDELDSLGSVEPALETVFDELAESFLS